MRELFEQEFPRHEKSLFLVALSYLHDTEDARDAVQEAALSAYRNIGSLRRPEYFKTWLTRIVINKSKDMLRSRRSTEELTDSLSLFTRLPEEDMELLDALCRMDSADARYIALRFYGELSYEEAARALGQNVSTVKYRTKKALSRLKTILEGDA